MIGLVDCNNFYASCERLFRPELRGLPVLVLSNNDGCVIARSNETKALGIKMGVPAFEIKELIKQHNIFVFSSNYTLYGDMSNRVMTLLGEYAPEMEIYSIDEAFLFFYGFEYYDLTEYSKQIVKHVTKGTGIPISIGIAPTKTLAKMASKLAKKVPANKGVFVMDTEDKINTSLKEFPIEDVWGIGRQYAELLKKNNVNTALDFINKPKGWIQKNLTVVGLRMWNELHGEPQIEWELEPPPKKNICTSRSFGSMLTEYEPIAEALSNYAARCGEKLRKQNGCANAIMVFLHTNQFRKDLPQYAKNIVIKLPVASNSNMELIHYALQGLKRIYKKGYHYKKVGIIVSEIVPDNAVQQNLFYVGDRAKQNSIMETIDVLNSKMGRDKVRIASQGFNRIWKLKQEQLSPCYTTRMKDIFTVNI